MAEKYVKKVEGRSSLGGSADDKHKFIAVAIFIGFIAVAIIAFILLRREPIKDPYLENPSIVINTIQSDYPYSRPSMSYKSDFEVPSVPENLYLIRQRSNPDYSPSAELASRVAKNLGATNKVGGDDSVTYFGDDVSVSYIDNPKLIDISVFNISTGKKREFPNYEELRSITQDFLDTAFGDSAVVISDYAMYIDYLNSTGGEYSYVSKDIADAEEVNFVKKIDSIEVKKEFNSGEIKSIIDKGWEVKKLSYLYYDYEKGDTLYPTKTPTEAMQQLANGYGITKLRYAGEEVRRFESIVIDELDFYYYNDPRNEWFIPVYGFRGKSDTGKSVEIIIPGIQDRFLSVSEAGY